MQSIKRNSSLAIAALAALGCADMVSAQSIIITNASNHNIPLAPGSSVQIDVNGNLLAQCALTNGTCTQLSNGGPVAGAPTASLSRNDGDASLTAGESVRLAWSSTSATVCQATSSGPAATTFTGPRGTSNAGGETVLVSTQGDYSFSLQCFNASGGSTTATVGASVAAAAGGGDTGGGGTTGCSISDPLIQPAGFGAANKSWVQAFTSPNPNVAAPSYPNGPGTPVPVGAQKGSYTAIQFTSRPDLTVDMTWDTAQPQIGYSSPRPADQMFVSISPCPGDLRPSNPASGDPWLQNGCRITAGAGSTFYTTRPGYVSNDFVCKLEPNQVYYINLSPVNPNDGLSPGEHTCTDSAPNSAGGCDVQMRHSGS
jgi:hypothetical protein